MSKLRKLRRSIADFILGDDTVLFTNGADHIALKESRFLDASDEAVGRFFKHFWAMRSRHAGDQAEKEGRTFKDVMLSGSVLYLASVAARTKADSADFAVSGSIDGGRTEGRWAVRVEACPDEPKRDPKEPEIICDPDDPAKIVSMTVTYENPGYEAWKAENAARRKDTPA
jgi:hypothetical protein